MALQCFLSSLPFPVRMCFPFLLENLLFDLCSCLNRSSCECCFLLPVQIYLLHPQIHTNPAGDARPGSADTYISVISVKACEEEQNLAPWVLWWISLACAMGFILSLLQTHSWNLSALTFYPLTYIPSGKGSKLTSSVLLTSLWTFICIVLLLKWYQANVYNTSHSCCETFLFHHSHSGVVCRSQAKQSLSALFFPKCKRGNMALVATVLVMCSYISVMSSSVSSPLLSPLKMLHRKYSLSHPEA